MSQLDPVGRTWGTRGARANICLRVPSASNPPSEIYFCCFLAILDTAPFVSQMYIFSPGWHGGYTKFRLLQESWSDNESNDVIFFGQGSILLYEMFGTCRRAIWQDFECVTGGHKIGWGPNLWVASWLASSVDELGSLEHPNLSATSQDMWAWPKRVWRTSHASNASRIQPMTILKLETAILGSNDTCLVLLCPRRVHNIPISSN